MNREEIVKEIAYGILDHTSSEEEVTETTEWLLEKVCHEVRTLINRQLSEDYPLGKGFLASNANKKDND